MRGRTDYKSLLPLAFKVSPRWENKDFTELPVKDKTKKKEMSLCFNLGEYAHRLDSGSSRSSLSLPG